MLAIITGGLIWLDTIISIAANSITISDRFALSRSEPTQNNSDVIEQEDNVIDENNSSIDLEINHLNSDIGIFRIHNDTSGYVNAKYIRLSAMLPFRGTDGGEYGLEAYEYFFYEDGGKQLAIVPSNSSMPFRLEISGIDIVDNQGFKNFTSQVSIDEGDKAIISRAIRENDIETLSENSICAAEIVGTYDEQLYMENIDCNIISYPLEKILKEEL